MCGIAVNLIFLWLAWAILVLVAVGLVCLLVGSIGITLAPSMACVRVNWALSVIRSAP
jgi:hypothetical protein